jgi:hypothetical protein
VKAAAAALLSFTLTGCAPAAHAVPPRAPEPVSEWQDGDDDAPAADDAASNHAAPQSAPPETFGQLATMTTDAAGAMSALEPDVVHRARIEMAREALVEENQNKERVDLAEQLQRELAALEDRETSKSRVRHGRPAKKQP